MSTVTPVTCRCGGIRGVAHGLSPRSGYRVVCYCDDCQRFANHLGAGDYAMDALGGTGIFQMSPARLEFTEGSDRLACLRMTPKGGLRWYARCCQTPIGNTPATAALPFVGLITACIDPGEQSLDDLLGPVLGRVMVRFATGDATTLENAHDRFTLPLVLKAIGGALIWRLRGDNRRSPFFDPVTGQPIAEFEPVGWDPVTD
jgi:hypothetical protein